MRTDLSVPFHEKDEAKALGAKWDNQNRTWFIVDIEDITPFMRWIRAKGDAPNVVQREARPRVDFMAMGVTGPAVLETCGCDVLPWEDCEHTEAAAHQAMLEMTQED